MYIQGYIKAKWYPWVVLAIYLIFNTELGLHFFCGLFVGYFLAAGNVSKIYYFSDETVEECERNCFFSVFAYFDCFAKIRQGNVDEGINNVARVHESSEPEQQQANKPFQDKGIRLGGVTSDTDMPKSSLVQMKEMPHNNQPAVSLGTFLGINY